MYRLILFLIAIFLIAVPYLQLPEIMQYDSKRIFQLTLLLLIGILLTVSTVVSKGKFIDRRPILSSQVKILLILLGIFGLISVFLSTSLEHAFLEYVFTFLLVALAFIIAPQSLKKHYLLGKAIFAIAIIYATLYSVIFFGNYISSFFDPMIRLWPHKYTFQLIIDGVELTGKEVLYFDNIRFFNHTQTWTLPILIGGLCYLQLDKENRAFGILLFFLISVWWMLIFVTYGRGVLLGLTASLIILSFFYKKDIYNFVKNGAITSGLGGVLYYLFFEILPTASTGSPVFRTTDANRFFQWEKALELWMQNPFFGIGPMQYSKTLSDPIWAHPHNYYVQFLAEWGVFAFVCFAILGFLSFRGILNNYQEQKRTSKNRIIYISFSWALLAAFIHAFFSGFMMTPMSQLWFVLIAGWFIGYNRKQISNQAKKLNIPKLLFLFLLVATLILVYDDIWSLSEGYKTYLERHPYERFNPRFWVQGLFE